MGRCQFDQMTDAPADKIAGAGQITVFPLPAADYRSNGLRHAGLFSDDKGVHEKSSPFDVFYGFWDVDMVELYRAKCSKNGISGDETQ